ncbi:MAG: hypothetical protein ACYCQJ_15870 [Nitrososphaerales archaeon]
MGFAASVNTAFNYLTQESINNIVQESHSICWASCTNEIDTVTIVIDEGSRIGDILIQQECQADSLCTIKTELESIATQQLKAIQAAEAISQPPLYLTASWAINTTTNIVNQTLENTISQVINTSCEAEANNSIRNVVVYANNNSEIAGLTIKQEANAQASCTIENTARSSVTQSSSAEQTATSKASSLGVWIIVAIAVTVVVIGTLYLNTQAAKSRSSNELEAQKAKAQVITETNKAKYDVALELARQGNTEGLQLLLQKPVPVPVK